MRTTGDFDEVVMPKRPYLTMALVQKVIDSPEMRLIQSDGRIRLWARLPDLHGRALRVVLLPDGETVHNAFVDRDAPLPPLPDETRES